ncbi:hypothetical protein B0H21DRAFT_821613 [Amylocystis lapponica]|nr:hypothetical protein B0H21DRAFT_821613 [Amylocystis lapponica]
MDVAGMDIGAADTNALEVDETPLTARLLTFARCLTPHPILASCSVDKSVHLHKYRGANASTLAFSHDTTIPTGHARTVRTIAWSPSGSGTTLVTASFDANIEVWEQEGNGEDGCDDADEGAT